jgi:putative endonuclease
MSEKTYWVYMLYCENDTYYTGYTTDINRRYQEHLNGSAKCKYTRSFKPLFIAAQWEISGTQADAMRIEYRIKRLTRQQKEKIISEKTLDTTVFSNKK